MKKLIAGFVMAAVAFSAVACGETQEPEKPIQSSQASEPLVPPQDVNTDAEELAEYLDDNGVLPGATGEIVVESGLEDAAESTCKLLNMSKSDPLTLDSVITGFVEGYEEDNSLEVLSYIILSYCPEVKDAIDQYAGARV